MPNNLNPAPSVHRLSLSAQISILIAILIVIFGGWYFFYNNSAQFQSYSDFYHELISGNASFADAQQLFLARNFDAAIPKYEQALQKTSDPIEKMQIQLLQASAMQQAGKPSEAVTVYKQILAADSSQGTARVRALAAQQLGNIYSIGNVEINKAIFSSDPIKSLWAGNDPSLTLRHVYEYSSSIYPTALSQLNIAQWYSKQLPNAGKKSATLSDGQIAENLSTIQYLVKSADDDITYMSKQTGMEADVRSAVLLRAIVIGDLNRHGDTMLGKADDEFKKAIEANASAGPGLDGNARYYYALHLAQTYGAARKSDIQATLAPLKSEVYAQSPVTTLLKSARAVAYFRQFPTLIARIDPNFKQYLISIGWNTSDF